MIDLSMFSFLMSTVFYINMLNFMIPITIAALGEIIGERSGIVNVGLEGIIMLGALSSVYVGIITNDVILAFTTGVFMGIFIGVVYSIIVVYLKGDQIISGVGLNLFAYGLGTVVLYTVWGSFSMSPYLSSSASMPKIYGVSYFVPLTILLSMMFWYIFRYTSIGLRIKSAGESPEVAEAAGLNVYRLRTLSIILACTLASLGGVFMGMDWLKYYSRNISNGRGFIALALVVFSNWNPLRLIIGGLIFGFLYAMATALPGVPNQFLNILPYIATLIIAAGYAGKAKPPASLGKPYQKE